MITAPGTRGPNLTLRTVALIGTVRRDPAKTAVSHTILATSPWLWQSRPRRRLQQGPLQFRFRTGMGSVRQFLRRISTGHHRARLELLYFRTLRCVNSSEKSSQGGQVRQFVRQNSLQQGDAFTQGWVWDPNDAPGFCSDPGKGNDGSEFKFDDGYFSNARCHVRDLTKRSGFKTITIAAGHSAPVRHCLMSNGKIGTIGGDGAGEDIHHFWADSDPCPSSAS